MRYLSIVVLVLLAIACSASAQQPIHPNTDRGFKPETVHQLGDLDNVNLFNGQLNLAIPIGPTLPMGGGNGYSLTLTYSSRVWDFRTAPNCAIPPEEVRNVVQAFPAVHSNAGLGWLLSLGRLITRDNPEYPYEPNPEDPTLPLELYEAPDGSRRAFYGRMHPGNALYVENSASDPVMGPIKSIGYTKDGTYMRRKLYASGIVDIETPDGMIRRFDTAGRLTRFFDAFGNNVGVVTTHDVPTDPASPVEKIELVDQFSRTTTIHFKAWASDYKNYKRLVDRVEFPSFGGGTATYTFEYTDLTVRRKDNSSIQYCDPYATVPFLTSISLPATASGEETFTFEYGLEMTYGAVSRMNLPTGGAISWTYDHYHLPAVAWHPQGAEVPSGDSRSLYVEWYSAIPATVQWYKNGSPIPGATSQWYSTGPLTESATYYARVSTNCRSVNSYSATITVVDWREYTVSLATYCWNVLEATDCGGSDVNARASSSPCGLFALRDLNGGTLEHGDMVQLRSPNGYWVVAEGGGGGELNANRITAAEWETFQISNEFGWGPIESGQKVNFRSYYGYYIVAEWGGSHCGGTGEVNCSRTSPGAWETFNITFH